VTSEVASFSSGDGEISSDEDAVARGIAVVKSGSTGFLGLVRFAVCSGILRAEKGDLEVVTPSLRGEIRFRGADLGGVISTTSELLSSSDMIAIGGVIFRGGVVMTTCGVILRGGGVLKDEAFATANFVGVVGVRRGVVCFGFLANGGLRIGANGTLPFRNILFPSPDVMIGGFQSRFGDVDEGCLSGTILDD
jgi:hypothetical protein